MSAEPSEPSDLDDLRRRLYGPEASTEDVARYEAARGGVQIASGGAEPPTPGRRRRRATVLGGAVVAVVVVAAVLVAGSLAGRSRATPSAGPSAAASSSALEEWVMPVAASVRGGFVSALDSGAESGLLRYLYGHPDLRPPELRTVERADSTEYAGEGPTTLTLSPSALAERGGRATVIVVLARGGRYSWRATRVDAGSVLGSTLATHAGETEAGAPVSATFAYGRGAPSRLSVLVPDGTRWGAVVVFTD